MTSLERTTSPDLPSDWPELAAGGSFYHQAGWVQAVTETYRFRRHVVTARAGARLVGGLALAEVPALVGPRRLVSLPFSYAAGPVTLSGHGADDAEIRAALAEEAIALARRLGIGRVEIKQRLAEPAVAAALPGFERATRYATYRVPMDGGESAVWRRLHASSTQRSIRKAERSGVQVEVGSDEAAWATMAALEEATAHRQGLPAPPRAFFVGACRALQRQGLAQLYLARTPDGTVAAGIVVWQGPAEHIYAFGASRPEALELRPNHALIWHAMRQALAAGAVFDLGRAAPEHEGLVEFKRRWGGVAEPLAYDYWPAAGGLNVARRDGGALALVGRVWTRLPRGVARRGAALYRYLG